MNDITVSWICQYLERVSSDTEVQLQRISAQSLTKLDTVDIIDLVELRSRYKTLVEVQSDLLKLIKWGNSIENYTK